MRLEGDILSATLDMIRAAPIAVPLDLLDLVRAILPRALDRAWPRRFALRYAP